MSEVRSSFQHRKKNALPNLSTETMAPSHPIEGPANKTPLSDDNSLNNSISGDSRLSYTTNGILTRHSPAGSLRSYTESQEPHTPVDHESAKDQITSNDEEVSDFDVSNFVKGSLHIPQSWISTHGEGSMVRNLSKINHRKLDEDVLQSLFTEERLAMKKIADLITMHTEISLKGSSSKRIRRSILACFKSLDQIYGAISELYDIETQRKINIVLQFEERDRLKETLLHGIEEIKDDSKGEGFRLKQLLAEKESVDGEIDALERRLSQLREKKITLKNEIVQSQSVIESRASSYLETLREVEEEERFAVNELTNEKSIAQFGFGSKNHTTEGLNISLASMVSKVAALRGSNSQVNHDAILDMMKRQIDSTNANSKKFKAKEKTYYESSVILENIAGTLDRLESELALILSTQNHNNPIQTKKMIINSLQQTYDVLVEREKSFDTMEGTLKHLLDSELNTISSGLKLLGQQIERETATLSEQPPPAPEKSINRFSPSLKISPPSLSSSPPEITQKNQTNSIPGQLSPASSSLQAMLKK